MAGVRPALTVDPGLLTAWRGIAYCHVPADEAIHLDRLVTSDGSDDRWNRAGNPTLYLALDLPTAVGELARHAELSPGMPPWRRRVIGLSVGVDGLLDIRRPDVRAAVGIDEEPAAFRDVEVARRIADRLREDQACAGLLVPSMTFLDDHSRGNLVVFVDRFARGIDDLVDGTIDAGLVDLRPPPDRGRLEVPMTEPKIDHEELRNPADPAAKDQPAEGGREEIDEDLRRADERERGVRTDRRDRDDEAGMKGGRSPRGKNP